MVAGIDYFEVDVAYIRYDPNFACGKPYLRYDKSGNSSGSPEHNKWYQEVIVNEQRWAEKRCQLRVNHWKIQSGCVQLFTVDKKIYQNLTIVFGQTLKHWCYFNQSGAQPRIVTGSRLRHVYGEEWKVCREQLDPRSNSVPELVHYWGLRTREMNRLYGVPE